MEGEIRYDCGAFVVLTLALGQCVSPRWYVFTAFVGVIFFNQPLRTALRANIAETLLVP
jgi:hypothetical protein